MSILQMSGERISFSKSAGHAALQDLQARHSDDFWYHNGEKQSAPSYLVLGCFPCYIADSRYVCTPVSEDARNQSLRNGVQHAAQTSCCNGATRSRCHWWR